MDLHTPFTALSDAIMPPGPLLRRQESLQGVLDFAADSTVHATPTATTNELAEALLLYTTILEACRRTNISLSARARMTPLHPFFLALYEYCPAPGQAGLLFTVLHALFPPIPVPLPHDRDYTNVLNRAPSGILSRARVWLQSTFSFAQREAVFLTLQTLADDLIRGFFVPLQAAGGQTPGAVSPLISARSYGDVGPEQGLPSRVDGLRQLCLRRDGHRCVVSRHLDWSAQTRHNRDHPDDFWDEDTVNTEVAHIIPHSFNALTLNGTLGPARTYAWRVMNMFHPGISHILAGDAIDSPRNAMTLAGDLHKRFGRLKWYLEPTGPLPHSYTVHAIRGQRIEAWLRPPSGIVTFSADGSVSPPDPRLIALHRACCLVLSMSGAGECVDDMFQDMRDLQGNGVLAADGSSDFAQYWRLRDVAGGVLVC